MDAKELKLLIDERENFLAKVLDFFETFVLKHGRRTKYEECSDYVICEMELRDFNGFDFVWKQGRSNNMYVRLTGKKALLDVLYCHDSIANCEVITFDLDATDMTVLSHVISNADNIWAGMEEERQKKEQESAQQKEARAEIDRLVERAKKLRIV